MLSISLFALLATTALSSPLISSDSLLPTRSTQPNWITSCEAATNCETYTDPTTDQLNIRFKAGMEPGTDDYEMRHDPTKVKRQGGYPTTQVTIGDGLEFWGCDVDPVATLNNVSSICATTGQCVPDTWSLPVTYVTPTADVSAAETLSITATGTYPSWIRNGLVAGVQAAMSANGLVVENTANYFVNTGGDNHASGQQSNAFSCSVATAPNFVGLGVYSAPNTLEATIAVSIAVTTPDPGFCGEGVAQVSALSGAMVGAFGAAGAALGAIFGAVSAGCSLTPDGSS